MSRHWALEASPLIAFCGASLVSVIKTLCDDIVIPAGVEAEINQRPLEDPARHWLRKCGHQYVIQVEAADAVVIWNLGEGATEVISYAHANPGVEAILDDTAAIACASALGIPVLGTLEVVLLAKKSGAIPAIKPVLQRLQEAGFRLDAEQIDAIQGAGGSDSWMV